MINLSAITNIISKVTVDVSKVPQGTADSSTVESILQFVFITAGSISVIMIAIGGFKYVTSLGERPVLLIVNRRVSQEAVSSVCASALVIASVPRSTADTRLPCMLCFGI